MLDTFKPEVLKKPLNVLKRLTVTPVGLLLLDGVSSDLKTVNEKMQTNFSRIADISALIYRMPALPPCYWDKIIGLGIDPKPSNVILAFKEPLESKEYPGYYIIPMFSNYVINVTGEVIKRSTGELLTACRGPLGYYTFRLTNDLGMTSNRLRHRIMAYTFKEYGEDVEDLEVNHLNGVPGDDFLDNLEWTTSSGNLDHAFDNGLRTDNKEVEVRDVVNNEIWVFRSYSAAGRFLGVTETTISNRCKAGPGRTYGCYQFRDFGSVSEWGEVVSKGDYLIDSSPVTAEVAGKKLGLTRTSFLRAIRGKNFLIRNNVKVMRKVPLGSNS